jgi:hypothetical protein
MLAIELFAVVACRNAAQAPEWASAEETWTVPLPKVETLNPRRSPASKFAAATTVPGKVFVGAGVEGLHVTAEAGDAILTIMAPISPMASVAARINRKSRPAGGAATVFQVWGELV